MDYGVQYSYQPVFEPASPGATSMSDHFAVKDVHGVRHTLPTASTAVCEIQGENNTIDETRALLHTHGMRVIVPMNYGSVRRLMGVVD